MIVEVIKRIAAIEVRIGPRGPRGEQGEPGESGTGGSGAWEDITGKPSTFPPSAHTHAIADTTGLQAALDGKVGASHTHSQSDVTGLTSALAAKADLVDGMVPTAQIPAIAITEFLGSVSSQSAMLALSGQRGDWCNRSDVSKAFVLIAEPASTLSNWAAIDYPVSPVLSVNGQTGTVVLGKSDIGLGNVTNALQLVASNNLSDLANAGTARSNLGLGTLATQNGTISDYLTAAAAASTYATIQGPTFKDAIYLQASEPNGGIVTIMPAQGIGSGASIFFGHSDGFSGASLYHPGGNTGTNDIAFPIFDPSDPSKVLALTTNADGSIADGSVTNAMLAGSIALSKLATTGTPNSGTYLRGDGQWTAVAGGSGGSFAPIQTIKTDTFSTTNRDGTWADVTGLSVSITPAAGKKVLVELFLSCGGAASGGVSFRVTCNGTVISQGDASSGKVQIAGCVLITQAYLISSASYSHVHSPTSDGSTSFTYQVQISGAFGAAYTSWINRSSADPASYGTRGVSMIRVTAVD